MPTDTVHWHNQNWPSVTLEIRRGNNATATTNPVVATPTIAQGQQFTQYSNGENFYYVRTAPPSDGIYIDVPCYGNGATRDEYV